MGRHGDLRMRHVGDVNILDNQVVVEYSLVVDMEGTDSLAADDVVVVDGDGALVALDMDLDDYVLQSNPL